MKKRDILKMLITGSIRPEDIPSIRPGGTLIQTGPFIYTDTKTGESFQADQLAKLIEPFKCSPFFEGYITGSKEGLLEQNIEVHPNARTPYLTEIEVNGIHCYQFKVIDIPTIKTVDDAVGWAINSNKNKVV